MQARLHDLKMKPAAYLVEREAVERDATQRRAAALEAVTPAMAQLGEIRAEAERRITQETAPARSLAAELVQLARAADERERIVTEFERLAQDRAARRMGFEDDSQDWQAMPKELREAIDRYNREPPEVQNGIRQELAIRPDQVRVIELGMRVRRTHARDLDLDQGLSL
jgi:hypothetical protein